jgi:hypothetical protein
MPLDERLIRFYQQHDPERVAVAREEAQAITTDEQLAELRQTLM